MDMLGTLGLLAGRGIKSEAHEIQPSGLSFSLTDDYPDKIAENNSKAFRMVGRRGQQGVYSISALNINSGDMRIANRLKTPLVDMLVSGNEPIPYSKDSVEKAQNLALGLLGSSGANDKELLAYMLAHDTVGYGPISMLLEDRGNIEEIVVNSPKSNICVYHSMHGFCTTNLRFNSERDFRYMINKTIRSTERELNSTAPIIDAQLDDGSRVHAQLKPYALNGAAASIRLNGGKSMDVKRLMELSTASPELLAYLWLAIETNHNMVVTGAPASGKTSLLLALNAFVPRYQRVITIEEDVNELKFYSNFINSVSLQGSTIGGKASTRDQVVNALHLRPDRLIVGEIRGKEASELLSGSNFGVPFMTTMHSSGNGQAVIGRLQSKPMSVEPDIISMLDISVFMKQCGLMARRIDSVVEYKWLCRDEVGTEELEKGSQMKILETGKDGALDENALEGSKILSAYSKMHAFTMARAKKELRNRALFLKGMLQGEGSISAPERIANYYEIK
jgi:Flp pilus assembly CpaF family ATPase